MDKKQIEKIAALIYNDLAPWERDFSKDDIIKSLHDEPLEVVKYLVERFIGEII